MTPLTRRHLLQSATAAGALALAGATPAIASAKTGSAKPAAGSRFKGDPGKGKLYYGASCVQSYGLATLERQLGRHLGVHRGYYVVASNKGMLGQVKNDHAVGRLPHVSTKVPGTWASVAAGKQDTWLKGLLKSMAADGKPVFFTLHHEPENDAGPSGMKPQDWREMYDHAVVVANSVAPNVTMVPVLMQFTFEPGSGRKPSDWVPTTTRVFGSDCYNAWYPKGKLKWRDLSDKMSLTLPYANGRPIVLAEYGCRTDKSDPGRAAEWMQDAFNWCSSHNVVSMSYFNSNLHSRFGTWELDTERLNAMKKIMSSAKCAWL